MVQVTLMHNVLAVDHTLVDVLLPAYISDLPLFFFFFLLIYRATLNGRWRIRG